MKKSRKHTTKKKAQREYDFKSGVRGKYAARYAKGSNVVVLSPDVAKVFPDSRSANRALRAFVEMIKKLPNFTVTPKR
jgi:urate oxidase